MEAYIPPSLHSDAFHCPHCNAYAVQYWIELHKSAGRGAYNSHPNSYITRCSRCDDVTIWINKRMVYPITSSAPSPNLDMPDDIKNDYNEARDVCSRSPRSACILLRLCVENICKDIGAKGSDLNAMIKYLVQEKGLDPNIQEALDTVRVIGGEAAHSLEMDLRDDVKTAEILFKIVNHISVWAYTRPKEIRGIFDSLPEKKKAAITERDANST